MKNEDPNDPRKPIGPPGKGDEPPTPAADLTCASSVQSEEQEHNHQHQHRQIVSIEEQRQRLHRQMVQWGLASGTSVTAVTVALVPTQVILAFILVLSMFMGLAWTAYNRARLEAYQIRRRGIVQYLPPSVVEALTQTSFHEWMTDGTFWEQNQHFFLYFIPGVTVEQLDAYVNRLGPRHRNVLRREGLGHFLGDGFMRFLIGEARYGPQTGPNAPPGPVPRRLDFQQREEDSTSQLQLEEDDAMTTSSSDYTRFWGTQPPEGRLFTWTEEPVSSSTSRQLSATVPTREMVSVNEEDSPTNGEDDNDNDEEEEDMAVDSQIIMEAIAEGIGAMSNMALSMVSSNTMRFFTRTPVRAGLTVTAATLGMGLLGMLTGNISTDRLPRMPSRPASNPVVYSSLLASGATAGIMYVFQIGQRSGGGSGRGTDPSPGSKGQGKSKNGKS
eukprot:scaffold2353_cov134-Cylindrotheca_fusiformis.AAC.9